MQLHITVTERNSDGFVVHTDASVLVNMTAGDAVVWATQCLNEAAKYAVGMAQQEDDDAEDTPPEVLKRSVWLTSITDAQSEELVIDCLQQECAFSRSDALDVIAQVSGGGVQPLMLDMAPEDALSLVEAFERLGCTVAIK